MARANSLSGLSDCLPIVTKSDGYKRIAGKDIREMQRMYDSEENEGAFGEGEFASFCAYECLGCSRKSVQEPKVAPQGAQSSNR